MDPPAPAKPEDPEPRPGPDTQAPCPSRQAAVRRRALHRAIAERDLEAMRRSIHELYVDEESPLRRLGEVKRVATYAPLVEATILARAYAHGTALDKEMRLNFRHTHASFGLSRSDHDRIDAQIRAVVKAGGEGGTDDALGGCADAEWCSGTPLHGRVKPRRHLRLFDAGLGREGKAEDTAVAEGSDWGEEGA